MSESVTISGGTWRGGPPTTTPETQIDIPPNPRRFYARTDLIWSTVGAPPQLLMGTPALLPVPPQTPDDGVALGSVRTPSRWGPTLGWVFWRAFWMLALVLAFGLLVLGV